MGLGGRPRTQANETTFETSRTHGPLPAAGPHPGLARCRHSYPHQRASRPDGAARRGTGRHPRGLADPPARCAKLSVTRRHRRRRTAHAHPAPCRFCAPGRCVSHCRECVPIFRFCVERHSAVDDFHPAAEADVLLRCRICPSQRIKAAPAAPRPGVSAGLGRGGPPGARDRHSRVPTRQEAAYEAGSNRHQDLGCGIEKSVTRGTAPLRAGCGLPVLGRMVRATVIFGQFPSDSPGLRRLVLGVSARSWMSSPALYDHSLLGVDHGRFCPGAGFELVVDVFQVLADGPGAGETALPRSRCWSRPPRPWPGRPVRVA
jgi:hypothetical protein